MEDPLEYTYDGIEREINLLEIHLKEAPLGDKAFCQDCIDKHIQTIRGFALEGAGFAKDQDEINNFLKIEKKLREIKGENYQKEGIKFSQEVRNIRKKLNIKNSSFSKKVETLTKDLNTNPTFNSYKLNLKPKTMVNYAELGMMNAGQFAAEGVRYLSDTYPTTEPGKWDKYITIGGGVGLQALGLFVRGIPSWLKTISLVAGSNLLAGGVVKMVKGAGTPAVGMAVKAGNSGNNSAGGYAGKAYSYAPTFGGKTFAGRVTATNIPSQYARAGILSGAQMFESPEHADLIRVD